MHVIGRVLVVDDEHSIRLALYQLLDEEGFQVDTASSGIEAIELMTQDAFEVVLLDIMMPGISGLEVLKRLLADYPDTVVIMVTANADIGTATNAIKDGAYDYLIKPFALDDVLQSVARGIEKRSLTLAGRSHQQELEKMKERQKMSLERQFKELVQALAREHSIVMRADNIDGKDIKNLPSELQTPKATIQDFAAALLKIMARGGSSTL